MLICALAQHAGLRLREPHGYITNGARMYVLSADEALMAISQVIPVRIQGC